jgi:hypothetical protein
VTRPIVQDVIAHDNASKTYNSISKSVDNLAAQTNKANRTVTQTNARAAQSVTGLAKVHRDATDRIKRNVLGASVAGGILATALVRGSKAVVDAAINQNKANAQTAAVIKSTGGAAHVTAKQVGELSGAISQQTGIMDDTVQASANMLLTFRNIRNEVGKGNDIFNQATKVVTDMSVALGQDGVKSAIQLGKALNDPIHGLTSLMRVGVTFTEAQKKQIKTLVEHGHALEAQKVILKELNAEFGGSAAAQATAGAKAAAAWDNLKEVIGGALLPVLNKLAAWFATAAVFLTKHKTLTNNLTVAVLALAVAFGTLAAANAAANVVAKANPYVRLATGLALLATALIYAYKQSWAFRLIVHKAVTQIVADFRFLARAVYNVLVYPFLTGLSLILHGAAIAFGWIPGLGGKLRHARDAFDKFKNEVNAIINRITSPHIHVDASEVRAARAYVLALMAATRAASGTIYINTVYSRSGPPQFRAAGGSVTAGMPYIVGERRPELFIPNQSGRIAPSVPSGGSGGGNVYITVENVNGVQSTSELIQSLQKYAKRNGSIRLAGITA